ncbi:MAG: chemotaxis protein CheW [Deltaproteobacteria bacterium]|jgi:purine-binding chemotaxis protein CheW
MTMQYLTFRLGEESFAVDVIKTQEVLDYMGPTRVPQTPPYMLGVINLRGRVVPVIDLRQKFGMPKAERSQDTCIIVMEILIGGEITMVGALVDSVQEVLDLNADQLEPPPRIGTKLKTEFIKAMGNLNDHFLIILDIDRVFSTDESMVIDQVFEKGDDFAAPTN